MVKVSQIHRLEVNTYVTPEKHRYNRQHMDPNDIRDPYPELREDGTWRLDEEGSVVFNSQIYEANRFDMEDQSTMEDGLFVKKKR